MRRGLVYSEAEGAYLLAKVGMQAEVHTLPRETPEDKLLAAIRTLAKEWGWLCYHTHDSRHSEAGFPDIILTNGVSLLMYELKDNTKKPSKDQALWLAMLAHTGTVECGIWRPHMWPEIVERLTRTPR